MLPGILLLALAPSIRAILDLPLPEWTPKPAERWVQGGPLTLADLRGKVVLIRFLMESDCPHCRATAPSLVELDREFAPQGLVIVGVYTPKPGPRSVPVEEARGYVKEYGFGFPVVVDEDWSMLRKLWLDRVPDPPYTSASLLVDRRGILRHVHEGGSFAKDAPNRKARADYERMRAAIVRLLAQD